MFSTFVPRASFGITLCFERYQYYNLLFVQNNRKHWGLLFNAVPIEDKIQHKADGIEERKLNNFSE